MSVESILNELDDDGVAPLREYVCGDAPRPIAVESWTLPMKLSGGELCIKEETTYGTWWYRYVGSGDVVAYHEGEDEELRGVDAFKYLVAAMADDGITNSIEPVLLYETPFEEVANVK